MSKKKRALTKWPPAIANWRAFEDKEPCLSIFEFPLYTDAWITGEITLGPYTFLNTVAMGNREVVRPAIVLRYALHKTLDYPDFRETNDDYYHGGAPEEEVACLASLVMGIRLRAGRSTRCFEPGGDPLGRPTEMRDQSSPYFVKPVAYHLPSAGTGEHSLMNLDMLNSLPKLSLSESIAIIRMARLYQDALWFAEPEPELAWLLFVSALETAANEWQNDHGNNVDYLKGSKPDLYKYLSGLEDATVLPKVSGHLRDNIGITKKFRDFVLTFLPEPPELRPVKWAQFNWNASELKRALTTIYGYRSKALHTGKPFPKPMCEVPHHDPSWPAPAELMTGLAAGYGDVTWLKKDIPMNLHLFEYITRKALLMWWASCCKMHG